jgi:hypothetical protein
MLKGADQEKQERLIQEVEAKKNRQHGVLKKLCSGETFSKPHVGIKAESPCAGCAVHTTTKKGKA